MLTQIKTLWQVLKHTTTRIDTVEYPDEQPYLAPRYRGRIVLTRDPDGEERCVACNLCAAVCPGLGGCIARPWPSDRLAIYSSAKLITVWSTAYADSD